MKINFYSDQKKAEDNLLYLCFKNKPLHKQLVDLNKVNKDYIKKAIKISGFDYKDNNCLDLILPKGSNANRIILIGANLSKNDDGKDISKLGSFITLTLNQKKIKNINIICNSNDLNGEEEAMLLYGICLNTYRFNKYFSKKKKMRVNYLEKVNIFSKNMVKTKSFWKRYDAIKEGVFLTRDLVSEPANYLTPQMLAKEATNLRSVGLKVEQLDEKKLKQLKMGALLGVAQGSANKPYVVSLEWRGNKTKKKHRLYICW
jgi:leucyl aminopeptidase